MKLTKFEQSVYCKRYTENKSIQEVAAELNCNEARIVQACNKIERKKAMLEEC